MPYTPVLATLGYIYHPRRPDVLMLHRNARPEDYHLGKYNGLGGKLRSDEDVVCGMQREIREESGLEVTRMRLAGTVSWPGFGPQGQDWFGFIFRIEGTRGQLRPRSPEGTLSWVPRDRVLDLPLWEGDRYFLPLVFAEPLRPFSGVMPYEGGRPQSWSYSLLH